MRIETPTSHKIEHHLSVGCHFRDTLARACKILTINNVGPCSGLPMVLPPFPNSFRCPDRIDAASTGIRTMSKTMPRDRMAQCAHCHLVPQVGFSPSFLAQRRM